jgi:putative spermidine/putrescine transport system substrate-binding protein
MKTFSNMSAAQAAFLIGLTIGSATLVHALESKPGQIVVNTSGGQMGESMRKSYVELFTKQHGIQVVLTSPPDFGKLRAMVESGNVEWTVTELSQDAFRALKMNLLMPIDDRIVDRSHYPLEARNRYLLTTSVYSTVLGYRKDKFASGKEPRTWADFWDVKNFPGPRSLRNSPLATLEFALLADGVKAENLYPLDVDRAFRKLDQIRPYVTVWWSAGAQPPQLLVDGEVVMAAGWNGRFYKAIQSGAPIGISWEGASIHEAYFGIPRGCPHPEWAQHFLAAMTDAKAQAVFANEFVSPGLNPESSKYTDAAVRPYLPTEPNNLAHEFWSNTEWWTENLEALTRRWNRWMLKN